MTLQAGIARRDATGAAFLNHLRHGEVTAAKRTYGTEAQAEG